MQEQKKRRQRDTEADPLKCPDGPLAQFKVRAQHHRQMALTDLCQFHDGTIARGPFAHKSKLRLPRNAADRIALIENNSGKESR